MPYTDVQPGGVSGFPRVLGLTSQASVDAALEVNLASDGYWLSFASSDRDDLDHSSVGIAMGVHALGTATCKDGFATGEYLDPVRIGRVAVTWHESVADLPPGEHPFFLSIDSEAATQIRLREEEHLADFDAAWDCSIGSVRWALEQITSPAATPEDALSALTEILVSQHLEYLVPADPLRIDAWEPRIRTVYADLCGHSSKRDKGEHTPTRYTIWADTSADQSRILYAPTEFGSLHPDVYQYVNPAEISVIFGGQLPTRAAPTLAVNDTVKWVTATPTLESAEWDVHKDASDTSDSLTDSRAIQAAVSGGHATVHSIASDVHVWVQVGLDHLGDLAEFNGQGGWSDCGYIKLRSQLLQRAD